jgi:pimeloyl-ACP methyl ester carboxylesterase
MDRLGIAAADVLGYSRGAWIAIATAISHPERVRAVIAGGAHPYAEDMSSFRSVVSGGIEQWVRLLDSEVGPLAPDTRARLMANDIDALRAALADDRGDLSNELARSGVPAMFYAGSNDPRASAALRFSQAAPEADFIELEGLNHFQTFLAVHPVVTLAERVGNRFQP